MIATRRLGRVRHEFRFGTRELVVIGVIFALITGLVFAGGVLVGREMSKAKRTARVEVAPDSGKTQADGLRPDGSVKTAATRTEEKVTFYRTLTAPTSEVPQVGKPRIEEHLIPKEEPVPAAVVPEPTPAAPEAPRAVAPERRSTKAPESAPATSRTARAAKASPASTPARPAPAQAASAPAGAEGEAWTVQVSAFRSRALAEELRSRLAARGFDAYVFPSLTEDGRPRYRVRVGNYASRNDAERVAADLRSERGLNPLVTSARVR